MTLGVLALLAACDAELTSEGTIVGNPGDGMVALARAEGLTFEVINVTMDDLYLEDCGGEGELVPLAPRWDLLEPNALHLPMGDWCELSLVVTALFVEGVDTSERAFSLDLEPGRVVLESDGFTIGEAAYLLELGSPNWVTAEALSDGDGAEVTEGHPLFEPLNDNLALGSALFLDADGDRALSEDERDDGLLAAGPEREEDELDTGVDIGVDTAAGDEAGGAVLLRPGCGGGGQGWLLLLLPLFRRRTAGGRGAAPAEGREP